LGGHSISLQFQLKETGYMSKGTWLLFLDSITSMEDFFSDIYILLDCEFLVAQRSNGTEDGDLEVSLTEMYNVHPTRPLHINPVARWRSNSGITWSEFSFLERRGDLQGISLKSGMVHDVCNKLKVWWEKDVAIKYEIILFSYETKPVDFVWN
jgi:hypothetical protein